jgi:cyclophilin family peptidyl-prolyl cis-trans isomerase
MKWMYSALVISALSACGGGSGNEKVDGTDTTAPKVESASIGLPANDRVTLTAQATDNTGVTAYCFKTANTPPVATDACFGSAATQSITTPTWTSLDHYVWAKDAANNVSASLRIDTTAPRVTAVSTSTPSNGQITLSATASDNTGVTGYCFKTTTNTPLPSDACFQNSANKTIDAPSVNSPGYFLWVKDAATNLSTAFVVDMPSPEAVPTLTGLTTSAPSNGQISLSASASSSATQFCIKTSAATPAANDACFSASASQSIATPLTPTRYYAWTKNSSNNISAPLERVVGSCSVAGVAASQASNLPTVCVSTSLGEFVVALEATKAPITVTNFLKYVNDGFYSQTVFHRVVANFMVQGGAFTAVPITSPSNAKVGTVYPAIKLETPASTGLSNTVGTIAMARTNVLDSATQQFFINVVNNNALDTSGGGYAVFGRVISGMDSTVESIRKVPVQSNGSENSQPLTPPVINWAYQLK